MDRGFWERKQQLEQECVVSAGLFEESLERLSKFMVPFVQCFSRSKQRKHAERFVAGLCSDLESKNSESIAYHFQQDRKTMQHFIGESRWDDHPLRVELASQIGSQLGEANGVLILDPSSFPKSGKESVGVARQWCGRLGKIDNCQVGLYLAYASSKGHALVDGELYLPKEWTRDKRRMKKAGVPKAKQKYKTRHAIFLELLARHGKTLPHEWIAGDDELGRPVAFRRKLHVLGEQYLLAVPRNTKVAVLEKEASTGASTKSSSSRSSIRIEQWADSQSSERWQPVDVRDAEKGPLMVEAIQCQVESGHRSKAGVATETAIAIRYRDRDQRIIKRDFYLSNAPPATPTHEYARVAKAEHRIEECFDRGKGEAGMGDYEARNWIGWHHHQTLSLLASWFLNVETRRAEKKDTSNFIQPNSIRNCFRHQADLRMRFTPRRLSPNAKAINAKPTRKTVSLAST